MFRDHDREFDQIFDRFSIASLGLFGSASAINAGAAKQRLANNIDCKGVDTYCPLSGDGELHVDDRFNVTETGLEVGSVSVGNKSPEPVALVHRGRYIPQTDRAPIWVVHGWRYTTNRDWAQAQLMQG